MTEQTIGRLLCGECTPRSRHVMARIVATNDGARIRAKVRRASFDPKWINVKPSAIREDHDYLIADMPPVDGRWWWGGDVPPMVTVSCPKHGWVVVTSDYLRDIEAVHAETGKTVVRVLEHPRTEPASPLDW